MVKLGIICYLVTDWDNLSRRPMIQAFAKNAEGTANILCLNPPICPPVAALFQRQRYRKWRTKPSLHHLSSNMWLYTPFIWLPYRMGKSSLTARLCRRMVAGQISTALSKIGFEGQKRVAWVRRPEQYRWLGLAGESHVLYECFDEYTLDISTGQPIPQMEKDEMYLLSKATMVFTTSDPLYQRKRHMHPKVYLTPNGTDFDFFCQAWKDALSLPPELSRIRRPIIGYAGHLGQFIDLGLLTYLAERRPEWSFVLLGSIDPGLPMKEVETLGRKPNVYLLGEKPYGLMPSYSRGFDASILPLLANEYLDCSNPLTLWEQLSAGRVVVATDLEEIHKLGNFVLLARSKEEFLSCIERALTGNNQERIDKGIAAAKEHSWDVLTRRALDIMLYELDNAR